MGHGIFWGQALGETGATERQEKFFSEGEGEPVVVSGVSVPGLLWQVKQK